MIRHYNIPIFLPELACPYRCVYCNQFSITGLNNFVKPEDVKNTIEYYLNSFNGNIKDVEVAFFGGSFTGIEIQKQEALLATAYDFIKQKKVTSIRVSTRPDYIDKQKLLRLGLTNEHIFVPFTIDTCSTTENSLLYKNICIIIYQCKQIFNYVIVISSSPTSPKRGVTYCRNIFQA